MICKWLLSNSHHRKELKESGGDYKKNVACQSCSQNLYNVYLIDLCNLSHDLQFVISLVFSPYWVLNWSATICRSRTSSACICTKYAPWTKDNIIMNKRSPPFAQNSMTKSPTSRPAHFCSELSRSPAPQTICVPLPSYQPCSLQLDWSLPAW